MTSASGTETVPLHSPSIQKHWDIHPSVLALIFLVFQILLRGIIKLPCLIYHIGDHTFLNLRIDMIISNQTSVKTFY